MFPIPIWFVACLSHSNPHRLLIGIQDEVFHIPQAQTYCRDNFFEWDDKITTPPGL